MEAAGARAAAPGVRHPGVHRRLSRAVAVRGAAAPRPARTVRPALRATLAPPFTAERPHLGVSARVLRDARYDAGVLWLHDGKLDARMGGDDMSSLDFSHVEEAAALLAVEAHMYCMPRSVATFAPRLAAAGVRDITIHVEGYARDPRSAAGDSDFIAGAVAAALDACRQLGFERVGVALLPGTNPHELLHYLALRGCTPDRVVAMAVNPGRWEYNVRAMGDKVRRLREQLDSTGCEVVAGGITSASVPLVARAGATEATVVHPPSYACFGADQLYGGPAGAGDGEDSSDDGSGLELAAAVRKDVMHRWFAASHIERHLEREMSRSNN